MSLVTNSLRDVKRAYEAYDFKKAVEIIFVLFEEHLLDFYLKSK